MSKHLIAAAPDALLEAVKAAAEKNGRTQADLIRDRFGRSIESIYEIEYRLRY